MHTYTHTYIYTYIHTQTHETAFHSVKVKVKQSRYRPTGFQEVKVPIFRDNGTRWW